VAQPISQSVVEGGNVTFSVQVSGTPPMSYRWRKNFQQLKFETTQSPLSFLTLSNVQRIDHGARIDCVITNAGFFLPGVLSNRATLSVLADTDGDGLPDSWEERHGFDPNDPTDAQQDSDSDFLTNEEEYVAGTDPNDRHDYLRIERIAADGTVTLGFHAISNRTYSVLYKNSLEESAWVKLEDVAAAPVSSPREIKDESGRWHRVYRLATPRQP